MSNIIRDAKDLEDAGEPTGTNDSPNAMGHELLMWTTRLEAVRSCIYEELEGGRKGSFDDSEKLWGAFNILGDVRDGQLALFDRLEEIAKEA